MKKFFIFLISLWTLSGCSSGVQSLDLSDYFGNSNGCAVIYDAESDKYMLFNDEMCNIQASPCSTFKIVSAITALDNGVVTSENDKMKYNGTKYEYDFWNYDLNFKEAFQKSCVWYFRQLTDKIGQDNMQEAVDKLNYGNKDISQWNGTGEREPKDLNGFWLSSSLEISPKEQVNVLRTIFESGLYSDDNISLLKDLMYVDEVDGIKIYGKTGTSGDNQAWFVGFSEKDNSISDYFAFYIDNSKNGIDVAGADTKAIAIDVIKNLDK